MKKDGDYMLEFKNLSIQFDKIILDNVSMKLSDHAITTIDGKSGSGKTAMLRFIINEIEYQSGQLYFDEKEINNDNRDDFLFNHVSYIDQKGSYFPNMTIKQHFEFYCQLYQLDNFKDLMQDSLKRVDLEHINVHQSPNQLSTGERKRFLIALALIENKDMIILDEPTASLDSYSKKTILDLIKELVIKDKKTILISSHDSDVFDISDNLYRIENKKIVEVKNTAVSLKKEQINSVKKKGKVKYRKYKNGKLKLISLLIVVISCISISLISQISSTYFSLNQLNVEEVKEFQNNTLFFMKKLDPRYIIDSTNKTESANYSKEIDILSDEDIQNIKNIEGVKEVLPSLELLNRTNTTFSIYKNGLKIKEELPLYEYDLGNRIEKMETRIMIIGYYPQQNLKKGGSNDVVYIDENMQKIIDLDDYTNTEIEAQMMIPMSLEIAKEEGKPIIDLHATPQKIKVSLNDAVVLTKSDYFDDRYYTDGKIYMPMDMLNELLKTTQETLGDDGLYYENGQKIEFQSRQYMILCEDNTDEQVRLEIDNLNPLYMADSVKMTNQDYIHYMQQQYMSTSMVSLIMLVILILATILMTIYERTLRKSEVILMKRMGIKKDILRYFRADNYIFVMDLMISMIGSVGYFWLFLFELRDVISLPLFLGVWLAMTIIMIFMFIMIRNQVIKKYIDKELIL